MKKIQSILVLLSVSLALVACGQPSKEDICGNCLDARIKADCEAEYDVCSQDSTCNVGDIEKRLAESGECPAPE